MSNALAIAATSAVLQSMLNDVFNSGNDAQLGTVKVSATAPDLVQTSSGSAGPLQVNLFLHQVTPNAAWRNAALPSLAADGSTRLRNQPLALDLHYLLTAYGNNNFEAEALLGYAVQLLHETPVLSRADIRTILPITGPGPTVANASLGPAGLADQVEMLKITPATLGREEMAWLWTALKSDYRPTFPFQVTVVLILAENPASLPLPVLRRHIKAQPNLLSPYPSITSATLPLSQPTGKPGDVVTLSGMNLTGATGAVLSNSRIGFNMTLPVSNVTDSSLQFTLPNPAPLPPPPPAPNPQDVPAGIYLLTANVKPAADTLSTNGIPFAAAPTITNTATNNTGGFTVVVTCAPYVRPGQDVTLMVGSHSAYPADPITEPVNSISFTFTSLTPSPTPVLLRLRVDGVDSQIIDMTKTPPIFSGPTVVVT
ncbi:MAG TPA: DUF4255 domain-containing protein [Verrucomicrobiae bacterium]|jgi:hypothetical protein